MMFPVPPHELFRRVRDKRGDDDEYEVLEMTDELYQLRREIIDIIHDAKELCDLPWIKVRVVKAPGSTLGVAWMEGNKMYITREAIEKDTIDLRGIVYHEILHTVFGVQHVKGCPLMDTTTPEGEVAKAQLDMLFVKYAREYGGECDGGRRDSKVKKFLPSSEAPPRKLYPIDWEKIGEGSNIDQKREAEKMVKLFWWCSVNDAWGWFDFDKFFKYAKEQTSRWAYKNFDALIRVPDVDDPTTLDLSDFKRLKQRAIDRGFDESNPKFFKILQKFMDRLKSIERAKGDTTDEKYKVADELIHLQHQIGSIWKVDIERVREEFEEEYR